MDKSIIRRATQLMDANKAQELELLFAEHPELFQKDWVNGATWLHEAAECDAPDVIRFFLKYFDIESTDNHTRTPLVRALATDTPEAVKTLVELGANVNHGGDYSPLSSAVYSKNKTLLKLLIDHGANNETIEELVHYGRSVGYANIEQDLKELNYTPRHQETLKGKLSEHYGALNDVHLAGLPCRLYVREKPKSFMVLSNNINPNAEILFSVDKFEENSVEAVLKVHTPWLTEWFSVIKQVEIDPTQRFIVIERDRASNPYQGILLLKDAEITINSSVENIYRLCPIHKEEIAFEQKYGMAELIKKFDATGLSEVIVNSRKSTV